jgi:hypothetical protein
MSLRDKNVSDNIIDGIHARIYIQDQEICSDFVLLAVVKFPVELLIKFMLFA